MGVPDDISSLFPGMVARPDASSVAANVRFQHKLRWFIRHAVTLVRFPRLKNRAQQFWCQVLWKFYLLSQHRPPSRTPLRLARRHQLVIEYRDTCLQKVEKSCVSCKKRRRVLVMFLMRRLDVQLVMSRACQYFRCRVEVPERTVLWQSVYDVIF